MESAAWAPGVHLEAIRMYQVQSGREVNRVQKNLDSLSADDKAQLVRAPEAQVAAMQEAVSTNISFIEKVKEIIEKAASSSGPDKVIYTGSGATASSKKAVERLLALFVREWSQEGVQERYECFDRLLGALDAHLGAQRDSAAKAGAAGPRVLCPSSGLGRLAFEAAKRGYETEGCEQRALLYFGSELLKEDSCNKANSQLLQPYALDTNNRVKAMANVRKVAIPDVDIASMPRIHFAEFLQLYDDASGASSFDAVVTAFALDLTPNILRYIRTVAYVVKPGGLWTNFGPLAYNTDCDEDTGGGVELSWDELKHAIGYFFEFSEEGFHESFNGCNAQSMMQMQYTCVFFSAVRNNKPAEGIGLSQVEGQIQVSV
eukprot:TRINITY_DN9061_c0_g1_i1.p1 TRINITY_DN9061_c0_g1~~TRINITY_DN9061_c0_g1_i1.p1  ORF type:complete len:374 (-),score=87.27 TRINITY_DN9061_c0_g1_i1:52-1173(-)